MYFALRCLVVRNVLSAFQPQPTIEATAVIDPGIAGVRFESLLKTTHLRVPKRYLSLLSRRRGLDRVRDTRALARCEPDVVGPTPGKVQRGA